MWHLILILLTNLNIFEKYELNKTCLEARWSLLTCEPWLPKKSPPGRRWRERPPYPGRWSDPQPPGSNPGFPCFVEHPLTSTCAALLVSGLPSPNPWPGPCRAQLWNQTSTQLCTLPGMLPPALSFNPAESELKAKLPLPGVCFPILSGVFVLGSWGQGRWWVRSCSLWVLTKCLHPHHLLGWWRRSLDSESLAIFRCSSHALTD